MELNEGEYTRNFQWSIRPSNFLSSNFLAFLRESVKKLGIVDIYLNETHLNALKITEITERCMRVASWPANFWMDELMCTSSGKKEERSYFQPKITEISAQIFCQKHRI